MGKRYRSNSITVEVDCTEALDEIDDATLIEEVRERGLIPQLEDYDATLLRDAYDELLRGRPAEARSILDRLLNPKWPSVDACKDACKKATAA